MPCGLGLTYTVHSTQCTPATRLIMSHPPLPLHSIIPPWYFVCVVRLEPSKKRKRTEPKFLVAFKSEDVIRTMFKQRLNNFLTTIEQRMNAFKCRSNDMFRFKCK